MTESSPHNRDHLGLAEVREISASRNPDLVLDPANNLSYHKALPGRRGRVIVRGCNGRDPLVPVLDSRCCNLVEALVAHDRPCLLQSYQPRLLQPWVPLESLYRSYPVVVHRDHLHKGRLYRSYLSRDSRPFLFRRKDHLES